MGNVITTITEKGGAVENIKLNIRAIAAQMGVSIEGLAEMCEINPNHLKQVSAGNVPMSAYDLKQISRVTKIPADNIYVKGIDD